MLRISISKETVYSEVDRAAAYAAAKAESESPASTYERVSLTSSDRDIFDRFWREAAGDCADLLRRILLKQEIDDSSFSMDLNVSANFDQNLRASVSDDLFSYFVKSLSARWYAYTDRAIAAETAQQAEAHLTAAHRKLLTKHRPPRPTLSSEPPLINQIIDLRQQVSDLRYQLDDATAERDTAAADLRKLQTLYEHQQVQVNKVLQDRQDLNARIQSLSSDKESLQSEIESLQMSYAAASQQIARLVPQIDSLIEERDSLQSQYNDAAKTVKWFEDAYNLRNTQLNEARQTIAELQAEVADLRARLPS